MTGLTPLTPERAELARQHLNGTDLMRGIRSLQTAAQGLDPQVNNVFKGIIGQPAQHEEFLDILKAMRDAYYQSELDAAYRRASGYFFNVGMYDRKGVQWESAGHLYSIAKQCADLCEQFMRPEVSPVPTSPVGELLITPIYK